MFAYCKTILPQADTCDKETFHRIINDEHVKEICGKIKAVADTLPEHPTEENFNWLSDNIRLLKQGNLKEHVAGLPGFCFQAAFRDNYRKNENAILSGMVTLDIDHIDKPASFFEDFKEKAIREGLLLAYISPSCHGLKMVFTLPNDSHTLHQAQQMIAKKLGVTALQDDATKDAARLSFAVPADYILYMDEDELFEEHELPIGFITLEDEKAAAAVDITRESSEPLPENKADVLTYKGMLYREIVDRLVEKLCGTKEPVVGQRHIVYFKAACRLRTICDDDATKMLSILPTWGLDPAECRACVKDALKYQVRETYYVDMENIVAELRQMKAVDNGDDPLTLDPVFPTTLPPFYKEICNMLPSDYWPTAIYWISAMLGVYSTRCKANLMPRGKMEEWHTPSFCCVLTAPPSSGKDRLTSLFKFVMEPFIQEAQQNYPAFYNYIGKRKDSDAEEPDINLRIIPEKVSQTSLSVLNHLAKGKHLLAFTPEGGSFAQSLCGNAGWANLRTIFLKSFDNDYSGQIYMSADSFCCNDPLYINWLMEMQPTVFRKMFNSEAIETGMVDRVCFTDLPDNLGCEQQYVQLPNEKTLKRLKAILEEVKRVGENLEEGEREELHLPRVKKALQQFMDVHREHYNLTQQNPSEVQYSRRARQIGFRVGMVAFLANGRKETKAVVDLAVWAAEYTLRMHVRYFGKEFNHIREQNQLTKEGSMPITSRCNENILKALPAEFSSFDLKQKEDEWNIKDANPSSKLSNWCKNGTIKLVRTNGRKKFYSLSA